VEKNIGETAVSPNPNHSISRSVSSIHGIFSQLLAVVLLLLLVLGVVSRFSSGVFSQYFASFVTIFLGIFIEAVPFLLLGSIVSGLIEVFVDQHIISRLIPNNAIGAAFVGALLGFTFPVCECGVVPVTRRLYQKGLPLSVGIAFLLAAPVVNPVVIISTYVAFGWGPVLIGRLIFSVLTAFAVGLLFSLARPDEVLRPQPVSINLPPLPDEHDQDHHEINAESDSRLGRALLISSNDFLDMVRYLIMGAFLAAGMQTLVPQATLLNLGRGPLVSVLVMMALAFVLSICSTVDAFVALSFVNTFTTGSILGFLVFGPMVDVKSSLMFLGVFRRRIVAYLILLPFLFNLFVAVLINLLMV
jgi:uncharacterized membrane protein YraQ (UPF0718 family)